MRSLLRAAPFMAWLISVGCHPTSQPSPLAGYIPKCPKHPLQFEVVEPDTGHSFHLRTLTTIPLSGELSSIVEVHDCQRLILPDPSGAPGALSYGPLATIFASNTLGSQFDSSAKQPRMRASAVIYSWNTRNPVTGDYPSLGIKAGWNCLYVYQGGHGVQARMIPATTDTLCLKPPRGEAGTVLEVIATPPPAGMGPDDIPPVARWAGDLGAGARTNHIWIRCGNMSCEIGPRGFKPERDLPPEVKHKIAMLSKGAPPTSRMVDIGGWYDHQLLAVPGTSGKLKVGTVMATLIPISSLGDLQENAFTDGKWQVVAFAYLPDSAATYSGKLNFEAGVNVVSLHYGPHGDGAIPAGAAIRPCDVPLPATASEQWWAMVTSASGVTKYFCVHRWEHTVNGKDLPGTVRWRWLDDDETTWYRCPKGCCPTG
jgi:hypothetical protein